MTRQWEIPKDEWWYRLDKLPPDLTPNQGPLCPGRWGPWQCTRDQGHTGRHAAGTGYRIVAVWPDPEPEIERHVCQWELVRQRPTLYRCFLTWSTGERCTVRTNDPTTHYVNTWMVPRGLVET